MLCNNIQKSTYASILEHIDTSMLLDANCAVQRSPNNHLVEPTHAYICQIVMSNG